MNNTLSSPSKARHCPEVHASAFSRVLVCLDRSVASASCLPYARFVAEAFGANVTLLHVMPSPQNLHEPQRPDALEWELAKREADLYLEHARDTLGVVLGRAVVKLTQGSPADQIVVAARDTGAELTIIARRGEGGGGRSNLGSIVMHVLEMASGSVLIAEPSGSARIPPQCIMVALDGSLRSECILPVVATLAQCHGAEVLLVHVVAEPVLSALFSDPDDVRIALDLASRMETRAAVYLKEMRTRLPQIRVVRTLVVRRGEAHQALLDVALEQAADVVVLTAHGLTCNAERVFGSVASYLLSHAQLPLFVFQDMPRAAPETTRSQSNHAALSTRPLEGE
jgi:nucleotide-binding universal stress UspA family protein